MKKIDLGRPIGILANLGVILGILFVAVEIHQNSEALGVQARQDRQNVRRSIMARTVDNPELGRILHKAQRGEDLTSFERFTLDEEILFRFISWEIVFNDVQDGLLDEQAIPLNGWRLAFKSWPGASAVWERYEASAGSQNIDFIEFVNARIVEP